MSVTVALDVGSIELLQVVRDRLHFTGGVWDVLGALDLQSVGYLVAGLFVTTWLGAAAIWKLRRIEQRWTGSSRVRRGGASTDRFAR
jgi:nickel/cobalt transporter (NiCoT) family protein